MDGYDSDEEDIGEDMDMDILRAMFEHMMRGGGPRGFPFEGGGGGRRGGAPEFMFHFGPGGPMFSFGPPPGHSHRQSHQQSQPSRQSNHSHSHHHHHHHAEDDNDGPARPIPEPLPSMSKAPCHGCNGLFFESELKCNAAPFYRKERVCRKCSQQYVSLVADLKEERLEGNDMVFVFPKTSKKSKDKILGILKPNRGWKVDDRGPDLVVRNTTVAIGCPQPAEGQAYTDFKKEMDDKARETQRRRETEERESQRHAREADEKKAKDKFDRQYTRVQAMIAQLSDNLAAARKNTKDAELIATLDRDVEECQTAMAAQEGHKYVIAEEFGRDKLLRLVTDAKRLLTTVEEERKSAEKARLRSVEAARQFEVKH
jgi:hypothetical protein